MPIEQRSDEWFKLRAGAFTASRASDLMARTKTGPSASRKNLITTLAVERLTGECVPTYQNDAMRRGTELEPQARAAYSFDRCVAVEEIAFIAHPTVARCGFSPDGLIGDDGLVELKCPSSMASHLEALENGTHAVDYRWQLQHQLFVSGRQWVDAVSYDPRWPVDLQLAIVRVERDEAAIADLHAEILKADAEIEAIVARLLKRAKEAA